MRRSEARAPSHSAIACAFVAAVVFCERVYVCKKGQQYFVVFVTTNSAGFTYGAGCAVHIDAGSQAVGVNPRSYRNPDKLLSLHGTLVRATRLRSFRNNRLWLADSCPLSYRHTVFKNSRLLYCKYYIECKNISDPACLRRRKRYLKILKPFGAL